MDIYDPVKWRDTAALEAALRDAGFSTRTVNALIYGARLGSIEDLRAGPWGDRADRDSLCFRIGCAPNIGPKGLAEILAFREGKDPRSARPPGRTHVSVPLESATLAALDAWIAGQTDPKPSRSEAIRGMIEAALKLMVR